MKRLSWKNKYRYTRKIQNIIPHNRFALFKPHEYQLEQQLAEQQRLQEEEGNGEGEYMWSAQLINNYAGEQNKPEK